MCYSAMVQQSVKQLRMSFPVRQQLDLFEDLFQRRLNGEKLSINKAMEYPFTHEAESDQEKRIASMIQKYHQNQISKLEQDLFKEKTRLAHAERVLDSDKPTKKAESEARIAKNKTASIKRNLGKHRSEEYISEDEKSVFPFHYLSMIVLDKNGALTVVPARYHLRPHGQSENFDRKYGGCYNARKDNLANSFWKPVFGKRHGVIVIEKFFEHVATEGYSLKLPGTVRELKNLILKFEPDNGALMFVPTLWDINRQNGKPDLISCALITDEPPKEIAETGHNRCPVFLKRENVTAWLNPKGRTLDELYAVLSDPQTPHYKHEIVLAA